MVMKAETGRRDADINGIDCGAENKRFGRKKKEMADRITLEKPDTNMREEVDTSIFLHCAATEFATDTDAAVYKHRATPMK